MIPELRIWLTWNEHVMISPTLNPQPNILNFAQSNSINVIGWQFDTRGILVLAHVISLEVKPNTFRVWLCLGQRHLSSLWWLYIYAPEGANIVCVPRYFTGQILCYVRKKHMCSKVTWSASCPSSFHPQSTQTCYKDRSVRRSRSSSAHRYVLFVLDRHLR